MVYVFLGQGFEEIEALAPVDYLRRAEIPVKTVGVGGKVITGSHGIPVTADITEDEVSMKELSMVVLPGGLPGVDHLKASKTVQEVVRYAARHDLYVAAICAAPSILAEAGLLKNKRAVCAPGFESADSGAVWEEDAYVVEDGTIITGRGPGAAILFAAKLIEVLRDKALSESLMKRTGYPGGV